MRQATTLPGVLSFLILSSCAHPQAVGPAPVEEPTARTAAGSGGASTSGLPVVQSCSRDDDCSANALCIRSRCVAITPEVELSECALVRVHFAFDQWSLRSEDKPGLERAARCLRADQKLHVTIEGNADERGTEEYNLQLGSKRAVQVERYLEALGASNDQLKTVSYGFERPLCTEHNEGCWAQNRRAALNAGVDSH
jgi:peptidoglycan-associated lipoprotein